MGKGKPFLEIFASALNEDYRFPILEVFAFLYALSTFIFASFRPATSPGGSGDVIAYNMVTPLLGLPLFIFIILIFKNIAYGFGSDLEKGVIQTYLSYPLKRHSILTAKLLSALGVSLLLFLSIQIFALYILAPEIVSAYLSTVLLTYLANLSFPLLISGLILLITLLIRKGGLAVIVGLILYFALGITSGIVTFWAYATNSATALQAISVFSPNVALSRYYQTEVPIVQTTKELWIPTFNEVLGYIGASYVIVASLFFIAYLHFCRRFSV
jgi:ABC-type transport system involved in multi-copper enzyme maturation permease subunit